MLKKIYAALKPGRNFIGTIYVQSTHDQEAGIQKKHAEFGVNLYESRIFPSILEDVGFRVEECHFVLSSNWPNRDIQFRATKPTQND